MVFFQKNISSFFTALLFVSFSFVLFAFVSQQTVSAGDVTEAACNALCTSGNLSSCGVCCAPGSRCPDTAAERVYGNCTSGASGRICVVDKNYTGAPAEVTTCGTGGVTGTCVRDCNGGGILVTNQCQGNTTSGKIVCCRVASTETCAPPGNCLAVSNCSVAGQVAGSGTCNSGRSCCQATAATCESLGGECINDCTTGTARLSSNCASPRRCCVASTGTTPPATGGGTVASVPQTITFTNPLAFNTVEQVLGSILGTLRGIIVILALVFIVIGAVLYITSAGNEGQMTLAKGAITAALIGLVLGIAAPSFLKEIGNVLGWNGVNAGAAASALTLSQIARNVLNFLLSIVGILGIIMLVIGGIMYLTAAGDEDRIDSGKKIVTYSIIGIIVALASLVIVAQIAVFFG